MVIGAELDKQIYKEGDSTWGCKSGVLDVEDVKKTLEQIELRMLKKFGINAGGVVNNIIKEEVGKSLMN